MQQLSNGARVPAQDPSPGSLCDALFLDISLLLSKSIHTPGRSWEWPLLGEASRTGLSSLPFSAPGWSHDLATELVPGKLSQM